MQVYQTIYITADGVDLAEFDLIVINDEMRFIEDKDGRSVDTSTDDSAAEAWSEDVYNQIVDQIEGLIIANGTRPTLPNDVCPSIDDIQNIRTIEIRLKTTNVIVNTSVNKQIDKLKEQYSDWNFIFKPKF